MFAAFQYDKLNNAVVISRVNGLVLVGESVNTQKENRENEAWETGAERVKND